MKPNLDLKSPIVKVVMEQYKENVHAALTIPQTVESAIIPIYAIPKAKAHNKPKTKPEQIGSGVLVKIKEQYFVFSATHIFQEFGQLPIITGAGNGTLTETLNGERYSSDIYDASVFFIQSDFSESLKKLAIGLDYFDLEHENNGIKPVYMAAGFRVKKSNTSGNSVNSKQECFPSVEVNEIEYAKYNKTKKAFILLAYENQVLLNGTWQFSPKPRGFSGGAIMKAVGTNVKLPLRRDSKFEQKLTAITIEQHRDSNDKPGVLIGTRIGVHLSLINQFMPDLLSEFYEEQGDK